MRPSSYLKCATYSFMPQRSTWLGLRAHYQQALHLRPTLSFATAPRLLCEADTQFCR